MPDGDLITHPDVPYHSGIGGYENPSLVVDLEVVEVHQVTCSTEGLAIFLRGLDSLGGEEPE